MKKFILYFLGSVLLIVAVAAIALYAISPGSPLSVNDANGNMLEGSISEIVDREIGGIHQSLIIRGNNATKPVMLFLHGGPGSPELAFMNKYNRGLEEDFVMVYWEQRGSGKSFSSSIPAGTMTLDRFVSDTREVTLYLAERFNQQKIHLMGHSWGSFLGMNTIWKHPELYHAFFSIGQVADQYKGERISFEWVKEQARQREDKKTIKKLSALTFPDSLATMEQWMPYLMTERTYVNKYGGGSTREITSMWPMAKMLFQTREYTFTEKFNYLRGNLFSLENLWMTVINTNLFNSIDSVEVPVYMFHGIHDYTTPYSVAREFYEHLHAPQKEFYAFDHSAHSPLMEEPDKFNALVRQIVFRLED